MASYFPYIFFRAYPWPKSSPCGKASAAEESQPLNHIATITKSMACIIGPNAASFIAECSNWVRHYCPLNSRYKLMHWHSIAHGHVKIITLCTFSIMHYFMYIYIVFMHTFYYWYVLLELEIGPEWMQQQNIMYLIK